MRILQREPSDDRERARIGDQAERYVDQVIRSFGEGVKLRGPLVPKLNELGQIVGYRETDFIVYTQGTVFCIEVKHYAGRISYLPLYASQPIWNGYAHIPQNVLVGYDDTTILQVKQGRRGQPVEQRYPNPLRKTKSFIMQLKKYMGRVEPRFLRLYITPVVCFASQADISAIYDIQKGMIQIEQLPAFLQQHRNERFALQPTPWITETILKKIPNWDRVQTRDGEWHNGLLGQPCLTFLGFDGRYYSLPNYASVKRIEISWQGSSGLLTVMYTNEATQTFQCLGGQLSLMRGPQPELFELRNLQQIVVGLANKLVM